MVKVIIPLSAALVLLTVAFVHADGAPPGGWDDDAWGDDDWTDDDTSVDHPSLAECEGICKKAELCHTPCAQTNCLTFCTKDLHKSQSVCEGMDTCEHINSCLCSQDPSSNGSGGGDDDNGGCSIAKGSGDIWLPLAMLAIGIGAAVFSLRSGRSGR